jgi:hypothetical protein
MIPFGASSRFGGGDKESMVIALRDDQPLTVRSRLFPDVTVGLPVSGSIPTVIAVSGVKRTVMT